MKKHFGTVRLVGAGPGDPELLTVRAYALVTSCAVLAYDELVPDAILALAPKRAERIAVGRRARGVRHHDARIHPAILARAREGRDVVRLKGGDPMIFGRGGEEIAELARAGIPYEVVPGITAALGAAASLGFPLTHRDVAGAVTFRAGHRASPAKTRATENPTLVFYMGLSELDAIASELRASGLSPETPALVVASATRPEERHVQGTLATIAQRARDASLASPALLFVGEVVRQARARLRLVRSPAIEKTLRRAPRSAPPSAAIPRATSAANHVQFARIDRPAKSLR